MAVAETVRNKITAIQEIIISLLHAAGLRKRFNIGNLVNDDCSFDVQKKSKLLHRLGVRHERFDPASRAQLHGFHSRAAAIRHELAGL
jgi:hypothetical protein